MKTYTATCDRCRKTETANYESHAKLKLYAIGVGFRQNTSGYSSWDFIGPTQEWCEDCCISAGVLKPKEPNAACPAPITVDALLREIVQQEVMDELNRR